MYTYMQYNNTERSRFNKLARVSQGQLEWLKQNKDTKTVAGYLDKIINHYKNEKLR